MGDTVHAHGRRRWVCLVVLTLAATGLLGVAAPAALAFDPLDIECADGLNTMHGDALLYTSCYSCHRTYTPVEPIAPVDTSVCFDCHWGEYENRPVESGFGTCWSCHYPGESQDDVQTSEGCAAATDCHDIDFANNLPHFGANTEGCTDGCHRTSAQSIPNGSPHHDDGAPGCYDCHDGARTVEKVHDPYVDPRDLDFGEPIDQCQDCHVGYETTHPDPGLIVHRTTAPIYKPVPVVYEGTAVVSGFLYTIAPDGTKIPIAMREVGLLEYKPLDFSWDALQLTDTMTDNLATTANETGKYVFGPVIPVKNTQYAALVRGEAIGTMFAKPARGTVLVKVAPKVTETLNKTSFALGGTITVKGKVVPWQTGGRVKWVFQRKIDGVWKTVTTTSSKLLTDVDVVDPLLPDYSTASHTYKPAKKGSWRVKTTFLATTEYTTASSIYKTFTVK